MGQYAGSLCLYVLSESCGGSEIEVAIDRVINGDDKILEPL